MAASPMASLLPTMVMTQRLWSESISRSSSHTPGIFMASTMASTLALSRPSEKFGTHSMSVDMAGNYKDISVRAGCAKHRYPLGTGLTECWLFEPVVSQRELDGIDAR